MLAQVVDELLPTQRVLVQQLDPGGAHAHFSRDSRAALIEKPLCRLVALLGERFTLLAPRAGSNAGHDQHARPVRISQAEVQRGEGAHAQTDDVRLIQWQRLHDRGDVVWRLRLSVGRALLGHIGGRITAGVEADAAVVAPEPAHLLLPASKIAAELMDEDVRIAAACFFVPKAGAIWSGVEHSGCVLVLGVDHQCRPRNR